MKCNDCYRGTHHGGECQTCRGTGHVWTLRLGSVTLTVANFWKPNTHARWVSGEEPSFVRGDDHGK